VKNGERFLLHRIGTWNCHQRVLEIINESTSLLYSSIGGRMLPLKEGKKEENACSAVRVTGLLQSCR
jgi:hypothetical protein